MFDFWHRANNRYFMILMALPAASEDYSTYLTPVKMPSIHCKLDLNIPRIGFLIACSMCSSANCQSIVGGDQWQSGPNWSAPILNPDKMAL